jgi:hypothetical protein
MFIFGWTGSPVKIKRSFALVLSQARRPKNVRENTP